MCYLRNVIQSSDNGKGLKNCAICGVTKKWIMNSEIRKMGADFIATGHNLDDEAQTFLINIFKGSPKLSANTGIVTRNKKVEKTKKFIPRIKPLFYVPENKIKKYSKEKKLPIDYRKCPCAFDSYRIQVRGFLEKIPNNKKENIIKNFEKIYPLLEKLKQDSGNLNFCKFCGEPSRKEVCKKCQLFKIPEN
jgi:uncharacterized protein (TIGR00269 family)